MIVSLNFGLNYGHDRLCEISPRHRWSENEALSQGQRHLPIEEQRTAQQTSRRRALTML